MRLHVKSFENGHVKRIHDPNQTPLDRLCHTKSMTPLKQAQPLALRRSLSLLQLRQNIQDRIDKISALPCTAAQGSAQDVFLTLLPQEVAIPQQHFQLIARSSLGNIIFWLDTEVEGSEKFGDQFPAMNFTDN